MRLPRVRLTVRWMMISVAVIALVLSIEMSLWDRRIDRLRRVGLRVPAQRSGEVLLFLNVAMAVPAFAQFKLFRQGSRSVNGSPSLAATSKRD
jgi:hypothetical protein